MKRIIIFILTKKYILPEMNCILFLSRWTETDNRRALSFKTMTPHSTVLNVSQVGTPEATFYFSWQHVFTLYRTNLSATTHPSWICHWCREHNLRPTASLWSGPGRPLRLCPTQPELGPCGTVNTHLDFFQILRLTKGPDIHTFNSLGAIIIKIRESVCYNKNYHTSRQQLAR